MRTVLVALLILLVAGSAYAYEPWSRESLSPSDSAAVAWLEDDILFVAITNDSGSRIRYTIEPEAPRRGDVRGFPSFTTIVPGSTVMLESTRLDSEGRTPRGAADLEAIRITPDRQRSYTIPVERVDSPIAFDRYVLQTRERLTATLDLGMLAAERDLSRIVIDDYYQILNQRDTGRIDIKHFSSGFDHDRRSNTISFSQPRMTLEMVTPSMRDSGLLVFDITWYDSRNRRHIIESPMALVVGSNYRFIDNAERSSR